MTNKQVIEHLKLLRDRTSNINIFNRIVFDKILQALDKQEPKKPIKCKLESPIQIGNTRFEKGTEILEKCPVCNNWVNGAKKQNCCDNCGQKLDWSDDND